MNIFGKWKRKAKELEQRVAELEIFHDKYKNVADAEAEAGKKKAKELEQRVAELQSFQDKYRNIVDAEAEAEQIINNANTLRVEATEAVDNAKLVAEDIRRNAEERNKELLDTISRQEIEVERNLSSLGILNMRLMLIEDLDIDPKIALQETEKNLLGIKEKVENQTIPNHVRYRVIISANSNYYYERKDQTNMSRLGKMAIDGEIRYLQSRANVNNIEKIIERARKKFELVNGLIAVAHVEMTEEYLETQLDKLRLRHSILERNAAKKKADQAEREILRKERQLERENRQLIKDAEKAAKDEDRALDMLEQARAQLEASHGEKMTAMQQQVERLEKALDEAHARNERAKSMAEMTKAGHVYVISNNGSFGEGVYKIGLTRRLDPDDRVRELGDASVPFRFDTHAMIWSENAPALEGTLHKIFARRRVNLVNNRREFFRVTLDEIKEELAKNRIEADVRTVVGAEEFRESQHLRSMIAGKARSVLLGDSSNVSSWDTSAGEHGEPMIAAGSQDPDVMR